MFQNPSRSERKPGKPTISRKTFIPMSVGKVIAELRTERDLTQAQLADKVGVSQSYLARWESGKVLPRPRALKQIARALGVDAEELVEGQRVELEKTLGIQDNELLSLFQEVHALNASELEALKTLLRGLLSRSRMEQMLKR
jgi:transcriptional regulator with XRE-family HTH domain